MRQCNEVMVIGAGLAGSEAAWQLAERGISVKLYEMRPVRMTEAHASADFAELVCSNSFGSDVPHSASRILKDEISHLGSFILRAARECQVPAGASLAVDRVKLSSFVTHALQSHPLIKIFREEVVTIPTDQVCLVASGPLTSPELSKSLATLIGGQSLYFYDAISPIVSAESLNRDKMFLANRYGKGESSDFLNIPLTKDEYFSFVDDLLKGDVVLPHEFEEAKYFEGCMPIEAIAQRGIQTLAFGPMKPVGLEDPKTGKRAYAVIQLRSENRHLTAYNLVGFQTKLKYKEQERIFRKLPGLENAEFLRLGSMHRNTFVDSPRVLLPTLQLNACQTVFLCGQLTGTEGYLESTASGLVGAINAARMIKGKVPLRLPEETMLGALLSSITDPTRKNFQPINSNRGILPPLSESIRDKALRNQRFSERSMAALEKWNQAIEFEEEKAADYRREPLKQIHESL